MIERTDSMNKGVPSRWLLVLVTLAVLVPSGWIAGRWAIGSAYGSLADLSLLKWSAQGGVQSNDFVARLERRVDQSLAYDPGNPQWREASGRLSALKAQYAATGEREKHWAKAETQYREAIALRPLWPYSWSNLAVLQYRAEGINEGFEQTFSRAINLGPWEPRVQRTAAGLAFAAWERFSGAMHDTLRPMLQRGMRRNWSRIIQTARVSGRLYFVCDEFELQPAARSLCERFGWTPIGAEEETDKTEES